MSLQSSLDRLDAIINRRASAEEAEPDRADASLADARRQRQRANAERRNEIASTYDDAFRSFGTQVPEPVDDEPAENFRKRLFNRLARRLAPDHELAQIRADDVSSSPVVFDRFEVMLLDAAQQEGLKPSVENLPDDGMVMRVRADANTGVKFNEFFGRESFVKGLTRPGRRVACILNPKDNSVTWGRPARQTIDVYPVMRSSAKEHRDG